MQGRHPAAAAAIMALIVGGLAVSPTMPHAQEHVFKIGGFDAPSSDGGQAIDAFAAAVAELSDGEMKVEVFHSAQLGPFPEQLRNVQSGTQSMMLVFPSFLGNAYPEAKVIGLPYVFRSFEHMAAYMRSELFRPLVDGLEKDGAIFLDPEWTWWRQDPRGFISVRPIFTPADMKGLKMRIWESKPAIETWRGFGANPIVVPRGEMYLAFQQGIIEGGPETIGVAYDEKNVEMGKYYTQTDEYYQILNLAVNKREFESLTPDQQQVLREAARVGGEVLRQASLRGYTEKRERARHEHQVNVILPDLAPWRQAGQETIARLEGEGFIPQGFIAEIQALKE